MSRSGVTVRLDGVVEGLHGEIIVTSLRQTTSTHGCDRFAKNRRRVCRTLETSNSKIVRQCFGFVRRANRVGRAVVTYCRTTSTHVRRLLRVPLLKPEVHGRLGRNESRNRVATLGIGTFRLVILHGLDIGALKARLSATLRTIVRPLLLLTQSRIRLRGGRNCRHDRHVTILSGLIRHCGGTRDTLNKV